MTTHTQTQEVDAEVAAWLEIDTAELSKLCRAAGRAGWASRPDRLGAVVSAASREPGARGPAALDRIVAGIYAESPRRQEDREARVRAEIARRCPARGQWQDQYLPIGAPPRDRRAFTRWAARAEARRRFPGASRSAQSRRVRFVLAACGPLRATRTGGAA